MVMTHRLALVLSITLALLVGVGVLLGRDQLFAPQIDTSSAAAVATAMQSSGVTQAGQLTKPSPRVVTIALPPAPGTFRDSALISGDGGERSVGHEQEDHSRVGADGYEHEGGYDDD
jgi:hypothetical protein